MEKKNFNFRQAFFGLMEKDISLIYLMLIIILLQQKKIIILKS